MLKLLNLALRIARILRNKEKPSLAIPLSSLRVHLAHCSLDPKTGLKIGIGFTRDGQPVALALPTIIQQRASNNVALLCKHQRFARHA